MKKRIFSALLAVFVISPALAQEKKIVTEQWVDQPTLHALGNSFAGSPAIVILDKRRVEYIDEAKDEVSEYYTQHSIVRVNDEKGIESFNKIYLGASNSIEIVDVKARTILPGGRVVLVDKKNIRDLKEESGNVYKIFAMEGLEKGCELEYIYTYKKEPSYFGRVNMQGSHPIKESSIEIIAPERLVFEIKPYNFETKVTDTVINGKRIAATTLQETPALEDEKYASYGVNLKRVEYKLSYNTTGSKGVRLFTWNEMAKRIYTGYTSYSEKELNKIDGLIKQNSWDKLASDEEKVIAIENFLKKNFATRDDIESEDAFNIEFIIKNKLASHKGIMRLYGAIFQQLKISFQFVFVCDRDDCIIDKNFENWNNCESPIFYFPSLNKFIAPTRIEYRYPYIHPSWAAANGLYCKGTTIGNFTTAIAEVKMVPLEDFSKNFNNIESTIQLNPGNDTLLIDMKQLYGGYESVYYRAAYNFASADEQKSLTKELIKFGTNSENVVSSEILNREIESSASGKPFVLHANVKASELLDKAGNRLLVKIGEIIGPQVEMYQEKPRQLPIKIEYPHFQERKIKLIIPDGYTVKNPSDLKLEHVYKENGDVTMGFTSDYQLEGNVLTVHIMEEYRRTFYPLNQYEEFKKIINTSADFNKIVLVLEKKN